MAKQKKPISKGLKTFFGVGDLGFNWMTNIETYYYAYFLTNIAQFPLALVTVIQTIGSCYRRCFIVDLRNYVK